MYTHTPHTQCVQLSSFLEKILQFFKMVNVDHFSGNWVLTGEQRTRFLKLV